MDSPCRMKFGLFLPPMHPLGEDPTLALDRDIELVQWLDSLGYDEAWIGEHHSVGWETIGSPELFMAVAAERTRHIKLGTGVISLPYHHPLMVADRMALLDHLTRGRVMLGVGPGSLASDAYMLGLDPIVLRERMDEALGIILRLFTETEPITYKSDWFELKEALLQLKPYQTPYMPIAVAATRSPSGVALAGKHGAAVLSVSFPFDSSGESDPRNLWSIAEESAAKHGKTMSREDWRIVVPVHLAESRKEAMDDAREGAARYQREYIENSLGYPGYVDCPPEEIIERMTDAGMWIVGTPDDCVQSIRRIYERSGGFGGFLVLGHEWAPREKILHSYELLARYVRPQFQGTLAGVTASHAWGTDHRGYLQDLRTAAVNKARQDYASSR